MQSIYEKGTVSQVLKDLVGPFSVSNHVVYMDNFFTSGPLVEELAQDKIYVTSTIKQRAGFPESLKDLKLSKGSYACERVREIHATMFLRTVVPYVLLATSFQKQSMETQAA